VEIVCDVSVHLCSWDAAPSYPRLSDAFDLDSEVAGEDVVSRVFDDGGESCVVIGLVRFVDDSLVFYEAAVVC
jgi:hypothetical protein